MGDEKGKGRKGREGKKGSKGIDLSTPFKSKLRPGPVRLY